MDCLEQAESSSALTHYPMLDHCPSAIAGILFAVGGATHTKSLSFRSFLYPSPQTEVPKHHNEIVLN